MDGRCLRPASRCVACCCSAPSTFAWPHWVKPFASFKPNVNPAYTWEPVIFTGGRKRTRDQATVRDWFSANITLQRALVGAKPPAFCRWICDLLGYQDGDDLVDLFPGTAVMAKVTAQGSLMVDPFEEAL